MNFYSFKNNVKSIKDFCVRATKTLQKPIRSQALTCHSALILMWVTGIKCLLHHCLHNANFRMQKFLTYRWNGVWPCLYFGASWSKTHCLYCMFTKPFVLCNLGAFHTSIGLQHDKLRHRSSYANFHRNACLLNTDRREWDTMIISLSEYYSS